MDEQALRRLVREAVARHLRADSPGHPALDDASQHPSHERFGRLAAPDTEGPDTCVIERGVLCTNCGYCKSYGH